MEIEEKKLSKQINRVFSYANGLKMFTNIVLQSPKSKNYLAYFICLDSFASRLISYTGFVYEDLQMKNSTILAKSFANLIYLRGALESTLIFNILIHNFDYAEKFLDNRNSDIAHINSIYKTSAPNHKENYKDFHQQNSTDNYRFERRFSWLPKYKKRYPFNLSDLLNYVKFSSDDEKITFTYFIRFFDNYSHPSFYIPSLFNAEAPLTNYDEIENLFLPDGIIDIWISFINKALLDLFKDTNYLNGVHFLSELIKDGVEGAESSNISSFKEFTDKLFYQQQVDIKKITRFFVKRLDIDRFVFGRSSSHPHYLLQNNLGLSLLVSAIKKNAQFDSYKAQCIYLLLQDASLRLADFHRAYYDNNYDSFYILARYLIEFLVTSLILLNDNEERSHAYFIHQEIKGNQANKNQYKNKKDNSSIDEKEKKYQENIETLKNYYYQNFDLELNDASVLRLNGWAIFLPNLNNTENLNFPALIQYSIKYIINELITATSLHYEQEVIGAIDFIQGFYEEACAYCHITPYGWHNNLHLYRSNTIFKEQYAIIISLFNQLFHDIIKTFSIQNDHEYFQKIQSTLLRGMEHLLNDLLKEHSDD